MSRLVRDLQLVDTRGRKFLAADERQRFLEAAARASRPADQIFALTLAHTGARISAEALAVCPRDVDLEADSIRIRTLKRRAERWREVPVPPEQPGKPLWAWSRATAHRKITRIRHRSRRRAAPDDRGRARSRKPADHRSLHHRRGPQARNSLARMWEREGNSGGYGV